MINGESLNLFNNGYRSQFNDLRGQAGQLGIQANWNMTDRNAINAIFNGENTQLGQLPGFQSAFSQVGMIQDITGSMFKSGAADS